LKLVGLMWGKSKYPICIFYKEFSILAKTIKYIFHFPILDIALNEENSTIFAPKSYFNMFRPDFSDIQKNGFRINTFRLVLSRDSKKFSNSKNGSTGNLFSEKMLILKLLIEQNEIHFTISYLSFRLMFLFIFATMFSLLSRGTGISLTLILALLSIILFLIARKYRENFILGDMGIKLAESIYSAKVNEIYFGNSAIQDRK
jgi:hypothetical protein